MMKRLAAIAVTACLSLGAAYAVAGPTDSTNATVRHLVVQPGDSWSLIARRLTGPSVTGQTFQNFVLSLAVQNGGNLGTQLFPGRVILYLPDSIPGGSPSTTTTTARPPSSSTTSPQPSSTVSVPSTTSSSTSSTSPLPTTTTLPPASANILAVPVGGALPSEATCAARVVAMTENRPGNALPNGTRGTSPNDLYPRVTGNFVGTTDEIIQWAACKWGMNLDYGRAQAALESAWFMSTLGDYGADPAACLPGHTIGSDGTVGQCPQSGGLLQTRYIYMTSAFEDNNALRSTAYNADYAWAAWRACVDGNGYDWLNTVEQGRPYAPGDGLGCMGVWYSGRWYTDASLFYMNRIQNEYYTPRFWLQASFPPSVPRSTPPTTTTTPGTTTTTVAPTTTTTIPPTGGNGWQSITPSQVSASSPTIVVAPNGDVFIGTGNQGLWRSSDRGQTWTKVNTGTGGSLLDAGLMWALQIDPLNSQIMWTTAGFVGGPLKSTDGGRSWVDLSVGAPTQSEDVYSIALDPYRADHVLLAFHSPWTTGEAGIAESFNGGQTWTFHQPPAGGSWTQGDAVFFLNNSSSWLVGTQDGGIWRTTNSGGAWQRVISESIGHGAVNFLVRTGNVLTATTAHNFWQSSDNGATWVNITNPAIMPSWYWWATVATDGVNLYTAPSFPIDDYGDANGAWFVRPISGGTWQRMTGSPNTCFNGSRGNHCNGPIMSAYDSTRHVTYTINWLGGVWRLGG